MKKRMRTRKSLNVKKRVVGFFAIAVILLGVLALAIILGLGVYLGKRNNKNNNNNGGNTTRRRRR